MRNQRAPQSCGDCEVVVPLLDGFCSFCEPPTASPFVAPSVLGCVNWDSRVCRDVQGDIMTERQLVLVFGVSSWLLRTRLVETRATWVMGAIMCFLQNAPSTDPATLCRTTGGQHPFASAIVAQSGLTQRFTHHVIDQLGGFIKHAA